MLLPDYRDMLLALHEHNAEFLLIGAYAMAGHGHVRATGDIDFWVRPTKENALRVWKALKAFGAPLFDLTVEDLYTPGIVFQIGLPPVRIDILTDISGIEDFEEAWSERIIVELDGLTVPILGRSHLLQNKRATGRLKDQNDVLWLENFQEED